MDEGWALLARRPPLPAGNSLTPLLLRKPNGDVSNRIHRRNFSGNHTPRRRFKSSRHQCRENGLGWWADAVWLSPTLASMMASGRLDLPDRLDAVTPTDAIKRAPAKADVPKMS